jgi:hypothetical protein
MYDTELVTAVMSYKEGPVGQNVIKNYGRNLRIIAIS